MKKTFKSFLLMLLTALAFSSCVDIPAPFALPERGGNGSAEDEGVSISCAQAVDLVNALADNAVSAETYTIVGYITEIVGNVSNNQQTFWMADTKGGGKIFEAYWANLPEGVTEFAVGTKVKITGKLMKYVKDGRITPEIKNPTVVFLEDDGGSGSSEEGTAITCAEAVQLTNALADGATSTETYSVTGYITDVFAISGKPCFWMADTPDGGKVFEAFAASLPEGVAAFEIGMKVKIIGKLKKYVKNDNSVTPEIENPTVVILENAGGGTSGESTLIDFTKGQGSWTINNVSGPEVWTNSSRYGQVASGYDNANQTCLAAEGWLLSPEIDLTNSSNTQFTINEAINKLGTGSVDQQCQVYARISNTADWQMLSADKRPAGTSWDFQDDNFNASAFDGKKIQLAFKYVSTESSAPSWEIKTIKINGGGSGTTPGGDGGDDPTPTPTPGGDEVTELVNGGFETWASDSEPSGWKSQSSASNATVSQSSSARGGSYSCLVVCDAGANKRLATQEITLAPGTYVFSFYAKAATADAAQTKAGYVPVTIVNDEYKVGSYKYESAFTDLSGSEWTLVSTEFTLQAETMVCLVVMNPKSSASTAPVQYTAQDILIDDATLVKK